MIAIDLSIQQKLDVDPEQTAMYNIIEETKEKVLDFSQGTVRVL